MEYVLLKKSTAPHSVYSAQVAKASASCMHPFSHLCFFLNTDMVFKVLLFSRFCVPRFLYTLYLCIKIILFKSIMIFLNCISIVLICTFVRTCTAVEIYLFATKSLSITEHSLFHPPLCVAGQDAPNTTKHSKTPYLIIITSFKGK